MKIDVAVKVIIALLIIMIISLAAALIIMNNKDDGGKTTTAVTTTAGDTTDPDSTTTPQNTTTPDNTTTPNQTTTPDQTTTPEVTTTPDQTTTPDNTTSPDETDPDIPDGLLLEKSIKSDTGIALNLRADVSAYEQDGKVYLTVSLYLEHYSISINAKYDNSLVIGGEEFKFSTDAIKQEENTKSQTLLCTETVEVEHGDTVSIEASFNSKLTYSGVKLDNIELAGTVNVK